jgi:2-oxoglutarate ferredoxin oxidoreductase subunit gamma
MQTEIIIAGFGGQGVLFGGMLLAQAAVEQGLMTTWFPSYGAEMRGGTANSTVVISTEEIGSPVITHPSVLIALNQASYDKFLPRTTNAALVIVNSSLVHPGATQGNRQIIEIPATAIADKLGEVRAANLVTVGAFLKAGGAITLENAKKACAAAFAEKPKLIPINQKALEQGFNFR